MCHVTLYNRQLPVVVATLLPGVFGRSRDLWRSRLEIPPALENLPSHLERLEGLDLDALVASLRRRGVDEAVLALAVAEATR